jgi:flagellar hook-associated protein 2
VQSSIESATKVTKNSTGKVTAAILADNREIQAFGSSLRSAAFAAVSGLSGSIARLENLGIDFTSGTNELAIKDSTKLAAALSNNSSDVEAFFSTATTGFSAVLKARIATGATQNTTQQANLNKANTSLDDQIAEIERRLEQQRTIMESAFINMEMAQSTLKSQQSALTNAFPTTTK